MVRSRALLPKEEGGLRLPAAVESQTRPVEERSLSIVVVGVLDELGPQEDIMESVSSVEVESTGGQSFATETNKGGNLEISAEQSHVRAHEESALVEQPSTRISEDVVQGISSPLRDRVVSPTAELACRTPPVTRSSLESAARF